MSKRIVKSLVLAAMALCMATTANAVVQLNIEGASAQFKFWQNADEAFLTSLGCSNVQRDENESAFAQVAIAVGENCTALSGEDVEIRYASINSSFGVGGACGIADYSDGTNDDTGTQIACAAGEMEQCAGIGLCAPADRLCYPIHLGASDVELTSFIQSTEQGVRWDKSVLECQGVGNQSTEFIAAGCDTFLDYAVQSVVVPFAFAANNAIKKHRCDDPFYEVVLNDGTVIDKSYPAFQWQCDPTQNVDVNGVNRNPDCVGYYKCIDSLCGGVDAATAANQLPDVAAGDLEGLYEGYGALGRACVEAQECPDTDQRAFQCSVVSDADGYYVTEAECLGAGTCSDSAFNNDEAGCIDAGETFTSKGYTFDVDNSAAQYAGTDCQPRPLDNISRAMAVTIFSDESKYDPQDPNPGKLRFWSQFGPYYTVDGTTPGLDDIITRCMRCAGSGTYATLDLMVMRQDGTLINRSDAVGETAFHHTSSSRLNDCIGAYAGAIGFLDADKILDDNVPGVHVVKYQGVEPRRDKIENCEYDFWASQWLYGNNAEIDGITNLRPLVNALVAFVQNGSNITNLIGFPTSSYWAAFGDLKCDKVPGERGYLEFKP